MPPKKKTVKPNGKSLVKPKAGVQSDRSFRQRLVPTTADTNLTLVAKTLCTKLNDDELRNLGKVCKEVKRLSYSSACSGSEVVMACLSTLEAILGLKSSCQFACEVDVSKQGWIKAVREACGKDTDVCLFDDIAGTGLPKGCMLCS